MLAEEGLDVIVVLVEDLAERLGVDILDHALAARGREHLVGRELEVQLFLAQQAVHQLDDLDDKLVLPQVIAILVHDRVLFVVVRQKREEERQLGAFVDVRIVRPDAHHFDGRVQRKRDGGFNVEELGVGKQSLEPFDLFRSLQLCGTFF